MLESEALAHRAEKTHRNHACNQPTLEKNMRSAPLIFLIWLLLPAFSQERAPEERKNEGAPRPAQTTSTEKNQSVLQVKPGTEALKEKDFYKESGYLHPFRRMPRFVLIDQKRIWTSPFHTSK